MPGDKVPKWFNYICKDGIPCFWVREEFPNVVLALVFQYADGKERINDHDHVQLHLVINGLLVPQKDYNNFIIEPHHVLVCDLRLLYNDEEWLSIDALLLKHEWNQVQISYEFDYSHVTLSEWGVFGYKQGTDSLEAVNLNKLSDGFTYDVFLSFKGEGVPLDFIAHLRVAFQKRRIDAFYDDENLRIGEDISPALCKAIEESNISVIVLSENYASSRWCLDELAKIMECTKRNNKQIVFPIFYHVDPSDVRHQRKSYGEAIFAHQDRFGKESEKIRGWKAALSEVADFEGHHIHTGHEIDHVKEIAGKVGANIAPKPSFVKYLVGLDQRIEEVKSLLDLKPNDNTVCVLGIIGVGGIGKTELAKAFAASNIEDLVNKCLLNVDNGYLNMHDLLHDMGREIFSQEVPNNPAKFNPMKVIILSLLDSRQLLMEPSLWNIRQLTIEEPIKQFSRLTVMNFKKNKFITTMLDVSKVENLRKLLLDYCENLTTVHESIGFFKHLVYLSASRCTKLEHFLQRMFLPSLEVLKLDWCKKLEHFPDIEKEMNTPLKIHMMGTSIKKLPNSVGNLLGLVSMDMQYSENLEYLPSSLFKLPNVVAFDFGGCSKLGESFRRILPHSPSEDNERSTLKEMHFANSGLSDEDVQAIFMCFPKLEELNVSYNYNLVSLPACIKEYNLLKKLNVRGCTSLTHISELPCTIQKVDASECFNISSETSDLLWDQVKNERSELEHILMPAVEVPKWFDYRCKGELPVFWVRGKFPKVVLALVFEDAVEQTYAVNLHVELIPYINGRRVPSSSVCKFRIARNHVIVCDLHVLFNNASIDALLKHEWNEVQIECDVNERTYELDKTTDYYVKLSEWGVYVYKQGTVNWKEHVQFMCPTKDPNMTIEDSNDASVNENHDDKIIGIEGIIPSPTAPEVLDETDQDTPMFEENKEHVTHEDSNDASVNEHENRDDKIIGIEDLEVGEIQDTPYPSGFFWRLLYTCFCKCFS
ncbi:hypothetical protein P8452_49346 [Trifolium repens]|nr:hypothetical protein P8452_49346 [Trifolium repens]